MPSAGPRVAVITTSTKSWENALWVAAADACEDLLLICGDDGVRLLDELPIKSRTLPQVDFERGLIYRHIRGLRKVLREFAPDVLHVNAELWSLLVTELRLPFREVRAATGRPVGLVVHGAENLWSHGGMLESRIRDVLVRGAVSRVDGYVSWNESGAAHVRGLRPDIPVSVVPAVVPADVFWRTSWNPGEHEAFRILLVGRAIREKGFDVAIEAVARMASPSTVSVTLCGEGPEIGPLTTLADQLGVRMDRPGFLSQEELIHAMSTHHVLVQPSQTTSEWAEQFGRSVAEAMALGLPCLASRSGALPEVLGHDGESLFEERDVDGLAGILDRLSSDGDALAAIARSQAILAERYRPAVAAQDVTRVWTEAWAAGHEHR